jgi:hypothetical protein
LTPLTHLTIVLLTLLSCQPADPADPARPLKQVRYVFELLIARLSERMVQIDWTAFVVEKVTLLPS